MADNRGGILAEGSASGSMALLRELQRSFYEIARQAELGSANSHFAVQHRAEQALKMLDSYIEAAQLESGQMQLHMSPYAVGSIMHEASHEIKIATGNATQVYAGVNRAAMTNAELLKSFLCSAGQFMTDSLQSPVILRSFGTPSGEVGVGVFGSNFEVTPTQLGEAMARSDTSVMPLATHSSRSGILLQLADSFAKALGNGMHIKRLGGQKGFAVVLPASRQLTFAV